MAKGAPRRTYQDGTVIQRTDGIPWVKTDEGWKPEHRRIMELRLSRDLEEGEKVFHLDNTIRDNPKAFNDPKNLAVIKCRTTKWIKFKHSRVLFEPKKTEFKKFSGVKQAAKS